MDTEIKDTKIAMIGLEGSGKTTFITTLAKRFSVARNDAIFLDPLGATTLKYIEHNWGKLQAGEWPQATNVGAVLELRWKLHVPNAGHCELRLLDASGLDIRRLFGTDTDKIRYELPEHLQQAVRFFKEADIILLLVNAPDFTGDGDKSKYLDNQIVIKSALDYITAREDKKLAVLFTKMDVYENSMDNYGGLNSFLIKETNYIYGAHIHDKPGVTVIPIASVGETVNRADEQGAARMMPASGFSSRGLAQVATWIGRAVNLMDEDDDDEAVGSVASETAGARRHGMSPPRPTPRRDGPIKKKTDPVTFKDLFFRYFLENLQHYANFSGRVSRREYWFFQLFFFMAFIAVGMLEGIIRFGNGALLGLFLVGMIIPQLGMTIRRLHDIGKNFWWVLYPLIFSVISMGVGMFDLALMDVLSRDALFGIARLSIILAGVSFVVLFIFTLMEGDRRSNEYGPSSLLRK
jgi:uncharacterized membrane protein YhaH (DUF805 family)